MKTFFSTLAIVLALNAFSQDTTGWRMITVSSDGELDFYYDDMSNLYLFDITGGGSGHALFVHPQDSLLYTVLDMVMGDGNRMLYQLNPFTGALTLVHAWSEGYVSSAEVDANGTVYAVTGNAAATPGEVLAYDWGSMTESSFFMSSITDGEPRALGYNWFTNSCLFIRVLKN